METEVYVAISLRDLAVIIIILLFVLIGVGMLCIFRRHIHVFYRRLYNCLGCRVWWRRCKYKVCGCFFRPGMAENDAEQEIQEAEAEKRIGFEIFDGLNIVDRQVAPKRPLQLESRGLDTQNEYDDVEQIEWAETDRKMLGRAKYKQDNEEQQANEMLDMANDQIQAKMQRIKQLEKETKDLMKQLQVNELPPQSPQTMGKMLTKNQQSLQAAAMEEIKRQEDNKIPSLEDYQAQKMMVFEGPSLPHNQQSMVPEDFILPSALQPYSRQEADFTNLIEVVQTPRAHRPQSVRDTFNSATRNLSNNSVSEATDASKKRKKRKKKVNK